MAENKKRLIIIDSNALIYRAYYALPPLTNKKGEIVNAVYGFLLVFLKTLKEFQPDFIVATFDFPAPTFRHKKYKPYKAKRPKMPEELRQQIPKIKKLLESFEVPIFEKQGFEADDIIGTISKTVSTLHSKNLGEDRDIETIILTGDLDALQLVDKNTKVYTLKRGVKEAVLYDEEKVREKYQGLFPEQLLDFKALRGDPSDNIPGVTGIGEKTAIALIKQFGSLENIYKELDRKKENAGKIKPSLNPVRDSRNKEKAEKEGISNGVKKKLLDYKKQAFVSRMLADIKRDVPIEFNLKKCSWKKYNREKVVLFLKNLGFHSLIKRLPKLESKKEEKEKTEKMKDKTGKNNLSLW